MSKGAYMKPIFCTDVTVNKNNTVINGTEFITRSIPEAKREKMDERASELQNKLVGAQTPGWMVTVRSIAGFAALVMAMNLFNVAMEKGFAAIFGENHITGTIICLGAIAIWFYLSHEAKNRRKQAEADPEIKRMTAELEVEIAMLMHEMGVPDNAKSIDILVFNYKVKDGEIAPVAPMMIPNAFMNFECKIFNGGDSVCLADGDSVYSFERSEIKGIRKVDSKITVYSWNKEEAISDPKFAPYSISTNKMGMVSCPYYYLIEIERGGEIHGLYIPCYEAEAIRNLFGIGSAIDADGNMIPLPSYIDEDDELPSPAEEMAEADAVEDEADAVEDEADAVEDEADAVEDEAEAAEDSEAEGTEDVAEADAAEAEENADDSEDENSEEDDKIEE